MTASIVCEHLARVTRVDSVGKLRASCRSGLEVSHQIEIRVRSIGESERYGRFNSTVDGKETLGGAFAG
jgi:hypothetical protein